VPQKLLRLPKSGIRVMPADAYRPLRAESSAKLLGELLEEWPLPLGKRFGTYLIPHRSRYSDLARVVECAVFQRFFGNTPECMANAYAAYEEGSLFFLVVDQDEHTVAGALRVIVPSAKGLKTLNDVAEAPLHITLEQVKQYHSIEDPRRCWDVGSLAVLKPYRAAATDHMVSLMLYGQLYNTMVRRGIEHMFTVLDKHAYVQLTEMLRMPIVPLAGSEPFSYLGSECSRAGYAYVPEALATVEAFLSSLTPEMYQVLRPYIGRVMYCEGMTELVEVQEDVERTGRVAIARLTR
jgi:hypothetical protein